MSARLGLTAVLALMVATAGCAKAGGLAQALQSRITKSADSDAAKSADATVAKPAPGYYCPMHPTYTSPKPGLCPICNMNLVPFKVHDDHTGHEMKPTDAQTVCLRHECPMLKAGETCPMLIVSETGETPECPVCQKRIAESELEPVTPSPDQPEGYAAVTLSAAKRQLIGVKTAKVDIRPLQTSIRTAGLMLASPEMNLFVYENDLPRITDASTIKASFPALGREFEGALSRIPLSLDRGLSPATYGPGAVLSAGSSQLTVRARLNDPDRALRRGMSADVEIRTDLGRVTALPETAVFFTGRKAVVFVERSEGVYEPREVKLGVRAEGHYAVQSGVEAGESVVTSGNFLIDSESRLRSAFEAAGEKLSHAH